MSVFPAPWLVVNRSHAPLHEVQQPSVPFPHNFSLTTNVSNKCGWRAKEGSSHEFSLHACRNRTTLFAVMASDVIMLNLWAHDVGRADGQAYSVLRSVFEEAVVRQRENGDSGGIVGGSARFPKVNLKKEHHDQVLTDSVNAS